MFSGDLGRGWRRILGFNAQPFGSLGWHFRPKQNICQGIETPALSRFEKPKRRLEKVDMKLSWIKFTCNLNQYHAICRFSARLLLDLLVLRSKPTKSFVSTRRATAGISFLTGFSWPCKSCNKCVRGSMW